MTTGPLVSDAHTVALYHLDGNGSDSAGMVAAATKQVLFGLDSLSYGALASSGQGTVGGTTYPAVALGILGSDWEGYNYGISGQQVAAAQGLIASQVGAHVDPGVAAHVVCVLGGTNDIIGGASAQTVYDRIVTYHRTLQASGYRTVAMTIMPANASATTPPGTYPGQDAAVFQPIADAVNALIRVNHANLAHGFVDLAADNRLDYRVHPENFGVDQTHPVDAGYAVMGALVAPQVTAALTATLAPVITSAATALAVSKLWLAARLGIPGIKDPNSGEGRLPTFKRILSTYL